MAARTTDLTVTNDVVDKPWLYFLWKVRKDLDAELLHVGAESSDDSLAWASKRACISSEQHEAESSTMCGETEFVDNSRPTRVADGHMQVEIELIKTCKKRSSGIATDLQDPGPTEGVHQVWVLRSFAAASL